MSLKKNTIYNQLEHDFNLCAKITAIELNANLEYQFELAVDAFYNDYDPIYYNRQYNTYYASSLWDSTQKYEDPIKTKNGYSAEIQIGSDFIPGEPYAKNGTGRPDKEWIFNRTWNLGIHGHTDVEEKAFGRSKFWNDYYYYSYKKTHKDAEKNLKKLLKIEKNHGYTHNQYKSFRENTGYTSMNNAALLNDKTYLALLKTNGVDISKIKNGNTGVVILKDRNYSRLMSTSPYDIFIKMFKKYRKAGTVSSMFVKNLARIIGE